MVLVLIVLQFFAKIFEAVNYRFAEQRLWGTSESIFYLENENLFPFRKMQCYSTTRLTSLETIKLYS